MRRQQQSNDPMRMALGVETEGNMQRSFRNGWLSTVTIALFIAGLMGMFHTASAQELKVLGNTIKLD